MLPGSVPGIDRGAGMKGKQLSLWAKIAAGVFVVVASVLAWIFGWQVDEWSIIQVGMFLALVFSPVDVSLIAEKFGRRGA